MPKGSKIFFCHFRPGNRLVLGRLSQKWAKNATFQYVVSSELDAVETSNNYVSTAFLQAHKRVWGAKALRVRLQLQKMRQSWPNFEIFQKRHFFHV